MRTPCPATLVIIPATVVIIRLVVALEQTFHLGSLLMDLGQSHGQASRGRLVGINLLVKLLQQMVQIIKIVFCHFLTLGVRHQGPWLAK